MEKGAHGYACEVIADDKIRPFLDYPCSSKLSQCGFVADIQKTRWRLIHLFPQITNYWLYFDSIKSAG